MDQRAESAFVFAFAFESTRKTALDEEWENAVRLEGEFSPAGRGVVGCRTAIGGTGGFVGPTEAGVTRVAELGGAVSRGAGELETWRLPGKGRRAALSLAPPAEAAGVTTGRSGIAVGPEIDEAGIGEITREERPQNPKTPKPQNPIYCKDEDQ